MADKTFLGRASLDMAIDAETHIDFVDRYYPIHRLDGTMAFLASHTSPYVRLVNELHEIGQRVDTVPASFEWRLVVVGPGPGDRVNSTEQGAAVASNTPLNWRNSGHGRSPRVLMAVLAGDFVNPSMHAMAERDRLLDIGTRRPGSLGKGYCNYSTCKQEQR